MTLEYSRRNVTLAEAEAYESGFTSGETLVRRHTPSYATWTHASQALLAANDPTADAMERAFFIGESDALLLAVSA